MSSLGFAVQLLEGASTPPATCGYALDDNGTIAAMFGLGFAPATAPNYQQVTYTYTGAASGGSALTSALNPFAPPANFTFASGKMGAGFQITTPPVGSSKNIYFSIYEFNGGLGAISQISVNGDTGVVDFRSGPNVGSVVTDWTVNIPDTATAKLGICINQDSGKFDFFYNGIYAGPSSASLTTTKFAMNMTIEDNAGVPVGQTVVYNIITDAANLTTIGFANGTVDVCGNPITYAPVACALPFSVPDAGITMTNSYETAALTTVAGTNSYATYAPYTTNFWDTPYVFPIGSGSHVFEWSPDLFPHPAGGTTYWQQVANFTDTSGNVVGYVTLEALSVNYNIQLYLTNGPVSISYTIGPSLPSRIGVAFDSSGPTVRVYVDDVQRLTGTYLITDTPIVINMNFETVNLAAGDANKALQLTYISDATSMTGTTYPAGSVDKCGNLV